MVDFVNKFYNYLMNGFDKQVAETVKWFDTNEYNKFNKLNNKRDLLSFWRDSVLLSNLISMGERTGEGSAVYVNNSFDYGNQIAHYKLNKRIRNKTSNDVRALEILDDYTVNLVSKLNKDFTKSLGSNLINSIYNANPRYRQLNKIRGLVKSNFNGLSFQSRAVLTSVTEHNRGLNTGLLQGYANLGVYEVEIINAGDDMVCDACLEIFENNPYSINEAQKLLPVHPRCRCSYEAVLKSVSTQLNNIVIDLTQ